MRGDSGFPVRIRFAKRGKVRFISHRDVARAFERAFRIEELPLAFTEGFSPRPKVSFGLALSVGHESDAEYLDVELTEPVDTDRSAERLTPALPEGMPATGAVRLIERAPALQESITEVQYRVATVDGRGQAVPADVLAAAAAGALASDELAVTRTRKGKESVDDLRPALRAIEVGHDGDVPVLDLTLVDPTPWCRGRVRCSTPSTGSQEPVAASASPSTACSELHNGSNAAARGWNRWPPTRSRPPWRRAHHERRNRCPTRRSRRRPHPRARPAAPAPLRPHHLIPHPLGPNRRRIGAPGHRIAADRRACRSPNRPNRPPNRSQVTSRVTTRPAPSTRTARPSVAAGAARAVAATAASPAPDRAPAPTAAPTPTTTSTRTTTRSPPSRHRRRDRRRDRRGRRVGRRPRLHRRRADRGLTTDDVAEVALEEAGLTPHRPGRASATPRPAPKPQIGDSRPALARQRRGRQRRGRDGRRDRRAGRPEASPSPRWPRPRSRRRRRQRRHQPPASTAPGGGRWRALTGPAAPS